MPKRDSKYKEQQFSHLWFNWYNEGQKKLSKASQQVKVFLKHQTSIPAENTSGTCETRNLKSSCYRVTCDKVTCSSAFPCPGLPSWFRLNRALILLQKKTGHVLPYFDALFSSRVWPPHSVPYFITVTGPQGESRAFHLCQEDMHLST